MTDDIEWISADSCLCAMSPEAAAAELKALYDEWPGGMDEIASSLRSFQRTTSILATFAHEVLLGAYKPEQLPDIAKAALERSYMLDFERVVALAARVAPPPSSKD